jgi:hypothetical protein
MMARNGCRIVTIEDHCWDPAEDRAEVFAGNAERLFGRGR